MSRILFVCLGNICRSPTFEGVARSLAGHVHQFASAGISAEHQGDTADRRSVLAAQQRGYDLSGHRARGMTEADFMAFEIILAMDRENLASLRGRLPQSASCRLALVMDYVGLGDVPVPDPYYGGVAGFSRVLDMAEQAAKVLALGD